jgi:hypothetical protein
MRVVSLLCYAQDIDPMTSPLPPSHGSRVERPRTLSFAQAAREYGLQPDDVRALVAAGIAWTVTPPGRSRARVVRDGLEAWVDLGRPPADRAARGSVYAMPKALSPRGGRRG